MTLPTHLITWTLAEVLSPKYADGDWRDSDAPATLSLKLCIDPVVAREILDLVVRRGDVTWPELEALLMSEDEEDAFLQQLISARTSSRKTIECLIAANAEGAEAIKALAKLKAAPRKAIA